MGNQSHININGKKYDAATGKMLTPDGVVSSKPKAAVKPRKNTGVMDGVAPRRPSSTKTASRASVKHVKKQPQKSQTLMRAGLKKPKPVAKSARAKQVSSIQKSSLGNTAHREKQVMKIRQSPKIHKYDNVGNSTVVKKSVALTTRPAPEEINLTAHKPQKLAAVGATATKHARSTNNSSPDKLLDDAVANANSHKQELNEKPHKTKRKSKILRKYGVSSRVTSISAAALAVVLLIGFFSVQNVPNLAMKVASTRAGFDASMPVYQPSGFSFNSPINYQSGQVTVSFQSNSDDREYQLVQTSSKWNSDALLSNYIVAENKQYQTFLDRGRTLYIYDGSNATWVDNGIWYQVEGESDLTTDQLVRIAASI